MFAVVVTLRVFPRCGFCVTSKGYYTREDEKKIKSSERMQACEELTV